MRINIVAGGPTELIPTLINTGDEEIWVGVDRGTLHLIGEEIIPDIAFGDFDSISKSELNQLTLLGIKLNIYKPEKDYTDLELALEWAIKEKPSEIRLYGITGGRLDHELSNIQMACMGTKSDIPVIIHDLQNKIQVMKPGEYIVNKDENFPYISFLSLFESVKDLTLQGFKYELTSYTLLYGSSLCVSNELSESFGTYSFTKGILMMIRSRDRFHP